MIATSVGGMPEAVLHNETGLIVPPADSAALAEAILRYFGEQLAEPFAQAIKARKEVDSWLPLVRLIEELAMPPAPAMAEQPAAEVASPRVL
jgi:glycosyltransferase involved in cell wall biosynthesis